MLPVLLGGGGGFLLLVLFVFVLGAWVADAEDEDTSSEPTSQTHSSLDPSYSYSSFSPSSRFSQPTDDGSQLPTDTESSTDGEVVGDYGTPEDNKIYDTGTMKSVGCQAPLRSSAPSVYRAHLDKVLACLDKAWKAQLAKEGMTFEAPQKVIFNGKQPATPCTSSNSGYVPSGFYCPANATMYFNLSESSKAQPDFVIGTAPHEYAHHVQQLIGIGAARQTRYEENYGDVHKRTRIVRRHELQAQCFSTVFMGGNAGPMNITKARVLRNSGGDDGVPGVEDDPSLRQHGTNANNRYWLSRGWPQRAGSCNTWTAPAARVA